MQNTNLPQQRPAPIIPDGAEVWIGMIFATLTWLVTKNNYDAWLYIPLIGLVYAFCIYMVNIMTEDYRMWARAMKKRNTVLINLKKISELVTNLNGPVANQLKDSLRISYEAVHSLDEQKLSGVMFTGYSEMQIKTTRLAESVREYVDILTHPSKAGKKYEAYINDFVEGFTGYHDWVPDMSVRANSGDLFNANTNALMLKSLRNLNLLRKDTE